MEETLTVTRLGITGKLKRTLHSTNPCESMISTVRAHHRNVKNWSSGDMACAGPPPGCSKPRPRFRKVKGYRGLANLAIAIERDLTRRATPPPRSSPPHSLCNYPPGTAATRSSTTNGTSSVSAYART